VASVISISGLRPIADYQPAALPLDAASAEGLLPVDRVSISPEARRRQTGVAKLTPEQEQQLVELKARDAHVRAHEAAHQAAGGDLTGAASFSYQLGPDGRSYAVGGEVPVSARSGRTPDETIAIARRVRAAALAPSDPSSADLAAAATASQLELQAMQQKRALGPAGPGGAGHRAMVGGSPRADLERLVIRAPEPAEVF